jgi:hypothetical protein
MADIARDVPVPGRDAVPALLRPAASGDCGVILMHGSAGDMNSGRLPLYADALAGAGFPVLRFTIKPPHMPTRVKCCQARQRMCASAGSCGQCWISAHPARQAHRWFRNWQEHLELGLLARRPSLTQRQVCFQRPHT